MNNLQQAIFYHIPKNAGRALKAFAKANSLPLLHRGHLCEPWHLNKVVSGNAFVFCVVRNPYARYVSAINYILGDRVWPTEFAVRGLCKALRQPINLNFIHLLNDDLVEGMVIFKPQVDYLNAVKFDKVYHLEGGMDKICTDLFLRFRPATDPMFPSEITNHHEGPFTVADLTDIQREAIQLRYRNDFAILGYNTQNKQGAIHG